MRLEIEREEIPAHLLKFFEPIPAPRPKDLIGIPWLCAFALRADGWYLRSDIIWHKPSPMPESVTDRPTKSHEYIFLLSKSASYFYDGDAIRETRTSDEDSVTFRGGCYVHDDIDNSTLGKRKVSGNRKAQPMEGSHGTRCQDGNGMRMLEKWNNPLGRNKRSVWTVASTPYKGAHFATFPPKLVEPMILAGTSAKGCCPKCRQPWTRIVQKDRQPTRPGVNTKCTVKGDGDQQTAETNGWNRPQVIGNRDPQRHCTTTTTVGWEPGCKCDAGEPVPCLVLDPFAGSGTTLAVAVHLGRHALGIELNPEYVRLIEKRLVNESLPLFTE